MLGRSVIAQAEYQMSENQLLIHLCDVGEEKVRVRNLEAYHYLIILEDRKQFENLKGRGWGWLKQWFLTLNEWSDDFKTQLHQKWLVIKGIPVH